MNCNRLYNKDLLVNQVSTIYMPKNFQTANEIVLDKFAS